MDRHNIGVKNMLILLLALANWPITFTLRIYHNCQQLMKPEHRFLGHVASQLLCICERGYRLVNETCFPICDPACGENFECIDVNVCQCKDGYKFAAGQRISISFCVCPIHTECTYQGVCECETGYKMVAGKCEAICDPKCGENAYCDQPNECRCKKGYEITILSVSDRCEPVCEPLCRVDQFCFKPGVCICKPGYVLLANGECEPICSAGCGNNERCVGVEYCECKPGFYRNETDRYCADLATCFKDHSFIIFDIALHCATSTYIIYLVYSPLLILPLIGFFLIFKCYGKFAQKSTKKKPAEYYALAEKFVMHVEDTNV